MAFHLFIIELFVDKLILIQTHSSNDCLELSAKLRALTRQKRKKLNNKILIKKLISNEN
jgi:hypothetical protein